MKLNYDCVRDVLLFLEAQDHIILDESGGLAWAGTSAEDVCRALPAYDAPTIMYALHNMEQAGLLDCTYQYGDDELQMFLVNYITFSGHEFLEQVRQDKRWSAVKEIAGKAGNFSLQLISGVALDLARQAVQGLIS